MSAALVFATLLSPQAKQVREYPNQTADPSSRSLLVMTTIERVP